jgi:cellulose synthase/poly-beta-1,6-N-acetylglucosamine synthase-like glycosyltransferase
MSFVILFLKFLSLFIFFIPLYCFLLYPIILFFLAWLFPARPSKLFPLLSLSKVSFLLPAFNEENFIEKKLKNLSLIALDKRDVEIIICDDGSTDKTLGLIKNWIELNSQVKVKLIENTINQGKWTSLKKMMAVAEGDIIVFSDISAILPRNFLEKMFSILNHSDVTVYAPTYSFHKNAQKRVWEKIYWPLEKFIRVKESRWFSTIGAHGACYAIKKIDAINLELAETNGVAPINDDFIIPSLSALNSGKKIYYDIELEIQELETTPVKVEYQRRVRIARGNFLMNKFLLKKISLRIHSKLYFLVLSHKILRSYIGPALCLNFLLYSLIQWGELRYNFISLIVLFGLLSLSPIRASAQVFFFDRFFKNQKRWK